MLMWRKKEGRPVSVGPRGRALRDAEDKMCEGNVLPEEGRKERARPSSEIPLGSPPTGGQITRPGPGAAPQEHHQLCPRSSDRAHLSVPPSGLLPNVRAKERAGPFSFQRLPLAQGLPPPPNEGILADRH